MGKKNRTPPERVVGFAEGIDDEAVALAFSKMQNLPQFKLVRRIPLKKVLKSQISNETRILDFGCGSGHFLIDLYQVLNRKNLNPKLYGLDIAQTMLEQCQVSFRRKNVKGIELILGDGIKIPVEDNYFNIVSTSLSLHHWVNPNQILTEIYRVISPGGIFVLFDLHRLASKGWFRFLKFITKNIVPKALREANEPYGSLQSSYVRNEILKFVKNTPWTAMKHEISELGPFITFTFQK